MELLDRRHISVFPTIMSDNFHSNKALVLFSGGQDSAACLAQALRTYYHVETIGFHYGQRHKVEMSCRQAVLSQIEVAMGIRGRLKDDHILDLSSFGAMSDTALTREREITLSDNGLPSSFVPGRNLIFFNYAAALAYRRGLPNLVGGMCETDFSGYPDCRRDTLDALQSALQLGMDYPFKITTPLMYLTKAETWALIHEIGGDLLVELVLEESHTCYLGERGRRHDWGYGCGTCPACQLRADGYGDWQASL